MPASLAVAQSASLASRTAPVTSASESRSAIATDGGVDLLLAGGGERGAGGGGPGSGIGHRLCGVVPVMGMTPGESCDWRIVLQNHRRAVRRQAGCRDRGLR